MYNIYYSQYILSVMDRQIKKRCEKYPVILQCLGCKKDCKVHGAKGMTMFFCAVAEAKGLKTS